MRNSFPPPTDPSRRRFVEGLALGGAAAGLGLLHPARARARGLARTRPAAGFDPPTLSGTEFDLTIGATPVDFTGVERLATTVNGSLPGPVLRWREGSTVTLRVANRLSVPTSIHWHGILVPYRMDGVPGISFPGIAPGETFTYRFRVEQAGTYWYHSHSGLQEQTGLYGPLVIEPAAGERHSTERDYVVMLNDWSDESPRHIFDTLKRRSDSYDYHEPTALELFHDARRVGLVKALAERRMWDRMRMRPSDLADVTGHAYTYLMNGRPPAGNWTGLFRRGEKVRLRFINGSAMTLFDVRIPGLRMTVVSADGQDVEPVTVDEFRIGAAEVYDVIVEPSDDRAWTLFAQSIDRTGYARGTLAPHPGMVAAVPPMDPRGILTMADVMGEMEQGMSGMSMPAPSAARRARTDFGFGADMRVDHPRTTLDDPGVGLRHNGRRVLTYADLHTIGGSIDPRERARRIELHLTGNMWRYMWSFDGVKFSDAKPIRFRAGERLRIVLVNDTMMNHPIHLHGMWSEVESPDGRFQVRKHTVNVQPAQRISYGVSANALGPWAYHCHMLYHMEAGMFREVVVA